VILTYIMHKKANERANSYIQRRIDIYQTLTNTSLALLLGNVFGFLIKYYLSFKLSFPSNLNWLFSVQSIVLLTILIGSTILIIIFTLSKHYAIMNYNKMLLGIIKEVTGKDNDLDETWKKLFLILSKDAEKEEPKGELTLRLTLN
jgi:hypothetical protein